MGANYSQTVYKSETDIVITYNRTIPVEIQFPENIKIGGDTIEESVIRLGSNGTLIHEIYKENFDNYYFNNYQKFTLRINSGNVQYKEYNLFLMEFTDVIELIKSMTEPYIITLEPLERIIPFSLN